MQSQVLQNDLKQLDKQIYNKNFHLLEKIMNYNTIDSFDIGNTKLSLMSTHPFKYLRGTAERYFDIFFETLKYTSKDFSYIFKNKSLVTACTNDTHVGNFGFTGKYSIFITNDFDEYMIGNPFMDILRYSSSMKFFIDDLNYRISANNLELRTLKHLLDEFENLDKKEILEIIESNSFFEEIIEISLDELEGYDEEKLKSYFEVSIKETLNKKIEINEYLKLENLEDLFFKEYFKTIKDEKEVSFAENSKMYKFYKKSKEKALRKNQLSKYTKEDENNKLTFDFSNEKLIDINQKKKELIRNALLPKLNKKLTIVDIARRKTAGVGSSHLNRYYILVRDEDKIYTLLEMKEQLKPVSLNFKKQFKTFFDIKLDKYESILPAKIHEDGIKLILKKKFDKNIKSLEYKNSSYILKTHFDSKQGFDEVKVFKYTKTSKDLKNFLDEYISSTARALAISHLKGLKVQIKNFDEKTDNKKYKKIKEKFQKQMTKYKNDKKLYNFLKTMTKNLSNMIFEDYLLFSKEFNIYQGYIKGQINTKLALNQSIKLDEIRGVLKEIVYTTTYAKHLKSKDEVSYRKLYNLIDNKKYKVENKTLKDYFKDKEIKSLLIDLVKVYLKKEEAFINKGDKHLYEIEFLKKINKVKSLKFK